MSSLLCFSYFIGSGKLVSLKWLGELKIFLVELTGTPHTLCRAQNKDITSEIHDDVYCVPAPLSKLIEINIFCP